jgi:putative transposase
MARSSECGEQYAQKGIDSAVYVVLGVNPKGHKEVLGLWVAQNEGAKFWLQVLTGLKNRGVKDIFIACVDGVKGFPEAIAAVYPRMRCSSVSCIWCGLR